MIKLHTFTVYRIEGTANLHWVCEDARNNVIGQGETAQEALTSVQAQVTHAERVALFGKREG